MAKIGYFILDVKDNQMERKLANIAIYSKQISDITNLTRKGQQRSKGNNIFTK